MAEENEAINEYLKREAFLKRHVAFMAGFSTPDPGEAQTMFKELIETEVSDADRDRILEIIDEYILRLTQLKQLCLVLYQKRKLDEEKE